MAQSTREMIDALQVRHDGRTIRFWILLQSQDEPTIVAHTVHRFLTSDDELVLVRAEIPEDAAEGIIGVLAFVNTYRDKDELHAKLSGFLEEEYREVMTVDSLIVDRVMALGMWKQVVASAKKSWTTHNN